MSGILDFLRGAIAPTANAVASYGRGKQEEIDKERAQAVQDAAIKRQGVLDQIKASLDAARAEYYLHGGAAGSRTPPAETPHTINTDQGIMQWDPATHTYKPTGYKAPQRAGGGGSGASSTAQQRLDAKTALDEATRATPRPSTVPATIPNPAIFQAKPGADIKKLPISVPNPAHDQAVADSIAYDHSTIRPLRQHLLDLTVGNAVPINVNPASGTTSAAPAKPKLSKESATAMQAEFDQASADYQRVLAGNAPAAVKEQARQLYNAQQASIAKKYGATSDSGPITLP